MTHSGDLVGVAWSRAGAIGLDVERCRPVDLEELRAALTDGEFTALASLPSCSLEAALIRIWVCKESVVKLTGEGLAGMRGFSVPVTPAPPDTPGRANGPGLDQVRILDLTPRPHYAAALALRGSPTLANSLTRFISPESSSSCGRSGTPGHDVRGLRT
ncbi:4'-phosphopantetheinyl transferase superfamily protein [Cryobacterium sp. MLB-32]|uniref:4'-phosphopantetheinyl transferase family protein n=1 Tax=Cryobacterium sp. MLB-32 TaxID=1529318 RepID=UPI0018CFD6AB|nr:4'-phosphopantetheinyl transferase superfamily protein [Cryobacterium sp. MLB-32]